jgi:hypothetical protein
MPRTSGTSPAVSVESPLIGTINLTSAEILVPALACPGSDDEGADAFVVQVRSSRLAQMTYCPLEVITTLKGIRCRTLDGYQAAPSAERIADLVRLLRAPTPPVMPPPALSARGRWLAEPRGEKTEIHVYDAAAIVTGHEAIAAYDRLWTEDRTEWQVWVWVWLDLPEEREKATYEALRESQQSMPRPKRPAASLKVSTTPVQLEIVSDPYIAVSPFGYAPVVSVRELPSGEEHRLFVSAKSLGVRLEEIRARRGSLAGARIELAKDSESQYARYVVDEL